MDPLFGFNGFSDDIMEHQGQVQTTAAGGDQAVGEYTISFPVDQSQNYSSQLQGSSQFGGGGAQQSNQVVHVVSGGSNDDKQVYVIKLENILQEGGGVGQSSANLDGSQIEEQMDAGQAIKQEPEEMEDSFYSCNEEEDDSSSTSSSSSSEEEEEDKKKKEGNGEEDDDEDDEGPDPFVAVSPESVMAMASSVGVDLSEEMASELGCIVTNKLRFLVLMAMQFSQHENTMGMMVEHFAKAEEQMGSSGFGHKSVFRDTAFKYAGGVSILDDGPEMDLYESMRQTENMDIPIDVVDPVLNVHHLKKFAKRQKIDNADSEVYDEPVVEYISEEEDDQEEETEAGSEKPATEGSNSAAGNANTNEAAESNVDNGEDSEDDELDINQVVDEIIKENNKEGDSETVIKKEKNEANEAPCETDDDDDDDTLSPEWAVYLQMLLELIVSHDYKRDFKRFSKTNFQRILDDVRRNGISPIFHIACDGFRDYLRNPELSQSSIMNILSMLDALVSSRCSPSHEQLNDVGSTLIEIIILPPPCEVHPFLTRVFMKVLKNCNELLTWTCTYVTEMLKGISETPLDQLVESFKSTMHGALCLANGLEEQSIRVAQEFGWHTSLLNFVKSHCAVFDGQAYSPTTQDSYLEEEILKFYHNFLNNYVSLIPPQEMSTIREAVESVYGERYLAFVAEPSHIVTSKKTSASAPGKNVVSKKTRCIFKKVVYKNREIIVPFRRRVK